MNFGVNRGILVAGFLIVTLSTLNQLWVKETGTGLVKILLGAYIALVVVSLVDLIPGMQRITTALAFLALATVALADVGPLWNKVKSLAPAVAGGFQATAGGAA